MRHYDGMRAIHFIGVFIQVAFAILIASVGQEILASFVSPDYLDFRQAPLEGFTGALYTAVLASWPFALLGGLFLATVGTVGPAPDLCPGRFTPWLGRAVGISLLGSWLVAGLGSAFGFKIPGSLTSPQLSAAALMQPALAVVGVAALAGLAVAVWRGRQTGVCTVGGAKAASARRSTVQRSTPLP